MGQWAPLISLQTNYFHSLVNRMLRLSDLVDFQQQPAGSPEDALAVVPHDPVEDLLALFAAPAPTAASDTDTDHPPLPPLPSRPPPRLENTLALLSERVARARSDNETSDLPALSAVEAWRQSLPTLDDLQKRLEKFAAAAQAITTRGAGSRGCGGQVVTLFGRTVFVVVPGGAGAEAEAGPGAGAGAEAGVQNVVEEFLRLQREKVEQSGGDEDAGTWQACRQCPDFLPMLKEETCLPKLLLTHVDETVAKLQGGGSGDVAAAAAAEDAEKRAGGQEGMEGGEAMTTEAAAKAGPEGKAAVKAESEAAADKAAPEDTADKAAADKAAPEATADKAAPEDTADKAAPEATADKAAADKAAPEATVDKKSEEDTADKKPEDTATKKPVDTADKKPADTADKKPADTADRKSEAITGKSEVTAVEKSEEAPAVEKSEEAPAVESEEATTVKSEAAADKNSEMTTDKSEEATTDKSEEPTIEKSEEATIDKKSEEATVDKKSEEATTDKKSGATETMAKKNEEATADKDGKKGNLETIAETALDGAQTAGSGCRYGYVFCVQANGKVTEYFCPLVGYLPLLPVLVEKGAAMDAAWLEMAWLDWVSSLTGLIEYDDCLLLLGDPPPPTHTHTHTYTHTHTHTHTHTPCTPAARLFSVSWLLSVCVCVCVSVSLSLGAVFGISFSSFSISLPVFPAFFLSFFFSFFFFLSFLLICFASILLLLMILFDCLLVIYALNAHISSHANYRKILLNYSSYQVNLSFRPGRGVSLSFQYQESSPLTD